MDIAVRLGDYLWRPLTDSEADTRFVLEMRNSEAAQAAFFTPRISREDHLRFLKLSAERDEINWIAELSGTPVGAGGMYRFDKKNRRAEAGRLIAKNPEVHLRTAFICLYVAFEHLGLNKLAADAIAGNLVSNRAGYRMGFVQEGLLREHVWKDGVAYDVVLFGALASEWQKTKAELYAQLGEPQLVKHAAVESW
jgi:UDP-4-amino-4,6-dideoxy-N-acetyl-beta-L-altrosamine N-acetyltransferase